MSFLASHNSTAKATSIWSKSVFPYAVFVPFPASAFTGKELDEETGYGYFGARYMDHELMTGWLSVDPMADKYPNISPYAYCAWNPMKLVDPDGREFWIANNQVSKNWRKRSIPTQSERFNPPTFESEIGLKTA